MSEKMPAQDNAVRRDEAALDDVVRRCFGVEPQDDPSGLDGSRSPVPPSEPDDHAGRGEHAALLPRQRRIQLLIRAGLYYARLAQVGHRELECSQPLGKLGEGRDEESAGRRAGDQLGDLGAEAWVVAEGLCLLADGAAAAQGWVQDVEGDALGGVQRVGVGKRRGLPPPDFADVLGVKPDRLGAGGDAAVALYEVLLDAPSERLASPT